MIKTAELKISKKGKVIKKVFKMCKSSTTENYFMSWKYFFHNYYSIY